MKYSIFPKPFTFVSPFPPDEVIRRLNELIVTSYPYYATNGKPYKGSLNGYSFEMQKITEKMKNGGFGSRNTPNPIKIMGTIEIDGRGSIIHLTSGRKQALVFVLIFAAVCLCVSLLVVIFTKTVFPLFFMIPSISMGMKLRQASAEEANEQAALMLLLDGTEVSDQ